MTIESIIEEAADTLRNLAELAGVPVIVDAKGDIDAKFLEKLGMERACVKICYNGFVPQIQGATAPNGDLFGTVSVVVSVFERPVTNRSATGNPTIMNMAKEVAKALHGASAEGMDAPMFLKRISNISELGSSPDGSVVTCTVEFETKASI